MIVVLWIIAIALVIFAVRGLVIEILSARKPIKPRKATIPSKKWHIEKLEELQRCLKDDDIIDPSKRDKEFFEELEKDKARFKTIMKRLGIGGDPIDTVMSRTRNNNIEWRLSEPDGQVGTQFEADFGDGIKVLTRGANMTVSGSSKPPRRIIHHDILFEDAKKRFDRFACWCNYFEHPGDDNNMDGFPNDLRPKELIDILTKKFNVEIKPQ